MTMGIRDLNHVLAVTSREEATVIFFRAFGHICSIILRSAAHRNQKTKNALYVTVFDIIYYYFFFKHLVDLVFYGKRLRRSRIGTR